ncbi:adenosine deaminase [Demequina activiva]|uniref:Adenine deaminase n=1 Tax=Demequina activiva TaxID=1582364 RepID=A0A919Q3Z2_9MICO|nr:adenosine deaminase [Demequina activiva]GIG55139.1 adenine deaminase [Demequina activiva]
MDLDTYLRLLPKTELHCHFASTMDAARLISLADREGVELPTTDPQALFDYEDLADFLVAFRAAHRVMTHPQDFAQVAYDGVRAAVASGALRYREYAINPQYFAPRGLAYRTVLEPIIDGLRAAEADLGVGFRIVVAISRHESPASAVELVETVLAHPLPEVAAIGQDDLTPQLTEDPGRFHEAYALARAGGLRTTAHAGERHLDSAENVRVAMDVLEVDRVDHGYMIVEDHDLTARARDRQIPFACTPISTTICSGWTIDSEHRIRRMIDAGLNVSFSTDDALFFRTDVGREFREALPALGLGAADARRIAMAGIDGAFCDDDQKARLRAQFSGEMAALDAALDDSDEDVDALAR